MSSIAEQAERDLNTYQKKQGVGKKSVSGEAISDNAIRDHIALLTQRSRWIWRERKRRERFPRRRRTVRGDGERWWKWPKENPSRGRWLHRWSRPVCGDGLPFHCVVFKKAHNPTVSPRLVISKDLVDPRTRRRSKQNRDQGTKIPLPELLSTGQNSLDREGWNIH